MSFESSIKSMNAFRFNSFTIYMSCYFEIVENEICRLETVSKNGVNQM